MFRMTKSQEIGDSDAYYEFTCTPCAGEGLNAEGKSYCGICNKDFCDVCIQYHKRFFDKHTVVESTQKDCRICDEETASYSVDNEIIEKVNDEEELTDRPWLQEVNTLQRYVANSKCCFALKKIKNTNSQEQKVFYSPGSR